MVGKAMNKRFLKVFRPGVLIGATLMGLAAMGGAAAANAIGSSGTLINPSAAAVRATTDRDSWSWDYHLDYLNGGL